MGFISFAVSNPVKVSVGVILAVVFGLIAYFRTPVQLTPDVEEPVITVTTRWPGASAREVEREIVDEQEQQLKSVAGLSEFKSESVDSVGTITLKFQVGADLKDAAARVRDKLSQVPQYPEDADEPTITTVNPNANAIAWFILQPKTATADDLLAMVATDPGLADVLQPMIVGDEPITPSVLARIAVDHPSLLKLVDGRHDPNKLRKFAQDVIEARLERVEGIANANVFGGREQELRVIVDPLKLAAHQLTTLDVNKALRDNNLDTSAGDIREGKVRNVLRTVGRFDDIATVEQTVIQIRDNTPIRVRDVARVEIAYKKPDGVVRQMGITSLAVNAQQAPQTNLVEIMGPTLEEMDADGDGHLSAVEIGNAKRLRGDSLRVAIAELNVNTLNSMGLHLTQVYDQTDYLNSATKLVRTNIYLGGSLALMVLLVFLRSPRSVLIVGLAIPISVIATFLFVRGLGRSINVISLAGMAFAVGMVVDNAIVVLENIFRHFQKTGDAESAARDGTREVWGAVLASTLTTLAVFVPVIFVEGQAGQLFRDISIAISCAVGLSLIVSITVIPTAARRILKRRDPTRENVRGFKHRVVGLFGLADLAARLADGYSHFIDRLLRMRNGFVIRTLIVATFVAASIMGAMILAPKTEYLPGGNRNLVIAIMQPPAGYSVEKMIELGDTIERALAPYWEAAPGSPEEAALNGPRMDNFFFVARGQRLFMGARSVDALRAGELVPVMRNAATNVPGVFAFATQASLFESALSGGRSIDIEIRGPDLERLMVEANQIFVRCMQEFPADQGYQVRPMQNLQLSNPEVHVLPRAERAAEMGLDNSQIGFSVNALVDGAYAGDFWYEGRKIDMVIFGAEDHVRHHHDLQHLPISTPSGAVVSLSTVADLKMTGGPDSISHSERMRSITLQLKPGPSVALETALHRVNTVLNEYQKTSQAFQGGLYQIQLTGTADRLDQTRMALQWNLVLAMSITYLLMAALFESYFYPLVIMTSVVLALVGGLGGLAILNLFIPQTLDMLTMLGFVILIGTVVNNAILIVHQALNLMHDEVNPLSANEAIVESVRTRIRPIFMSTLTTVLGMLPLVLPMPHWTASGFMWVAGAGSELYRGLGSVVLGGLIVSTIFTLLLVPIGFSLSLDAKRVGRALLKRVARSSDEPAEPKSSRALDSVRTSA